MDLSLSLVVHQQQTTFFLLKSIIFILIIQKHIKKQKGFVKHNTSYVSVTSVFSFLWQDGQPNRILLVSIHQVIYPMTVDVLNQVFSPYGFVEKVVTFQKSAG